MRNTKQVSGKLKIIKRLPSSINGNPRYLISVNGVICKTGVDSSYGYSVTNYRDQDVISTIGDHYGVMTLDSLKPAPVQLELF